MEINRLLMLAFLLFLPWALPEEDERAFVYKACAPQTQSYDSERLPSLLGELAEQSWYSSFMRSREIEGMTGVFQCREDLTGEECGRCVNLAGQMCLTACGQSAAAARVQLEGCYAQYEMEEKEWERGQLLYRECHGNEAMMEAVLEKMMMSMDIIRRGYYRGNHDSSLVMIGECESDLDECECRQCFTLALHQCPASLSARIYLPSCSLSYHSPSLNHLHNNSSSSNATRIAAIALGAALALCIGLFFLFFLISRYSKRHYYH